jgi:hypothetical protein
MTSCRCLAAVFSLILAGYCHAVYAGDGPWHRLETRYAELHYAGPEDLARLDRRLDVDIIDRSLLRAFGFFVRPDDPKLPARVAAKIDAVTRRVQEILGMFPKGFNVRIFLFHDGRALDAFYRKRFLRPAPSHGLYNPREHAVYLDLSKVNEGVLAHELGHAVITVFSVIPPPSATQEILCQYIDEHFHYW